MDRNKLEAEILKIISKKNGCKMTDFLEDKEVEKLAEAIGMHEVHAVAYDMAEKGKVIALDYSDGDNCSFNEVFLMPKHYTGSFRPSR